MLQCVKASGGPLESRFETDCAEDAEPSRVSDVADKAVVSGRGLWRLSSAEAIEKVGEHSSRIVLPQQSKLGGTMFESLLRRSICWRINLSPRTPRNTFSTPSARTGHCLELQRSVSQIIRANRAPGVRFKVSVKAAPEQLQPEPDVPRDVESRSGPSDSKIFTPANVSFWLTTDSPAMSLVRPLTGWPEAVTRLRLPQNGACGFVG